MVLAHKARSKERDNLVTHESINHRVVFDQNVAGFLVEAIKNILEPAWTFRFRTGAEHAHTLFARITQPGTETGRP